MPDSVQGVVADTCYEDGANFVLPSPAVPEGGSAALSHHDALLQHGVYDGGPGASLDAAGDSVVPASALDDDICTPEDTWARGAVAPSPPCRPAAAAGARGPSLRKSTHRLTD